MSPLNLLLRLNDGPPVRRWGAGRLAVHTVNDPALISDILLRQAPSFVKGKMFTRAGAYFGEGLGLNRSTPDGPRLHEPRLEHHRIIQPAFGAEHKQFYRDVSRSVAEEEVSRWHTGQTVDLCAAARRTAGKSAVRALLGPAPEAQITALVERLVAGLVWGTLTHWARYARTVEALSELLGDPILANATPLIQTLTAAGLTEREIKSHLFAILMPSVATVADTIPWLFYELSRQPATADSPYLVKETLRLHAPQWVLSRRTIEPVRLGDTLLPTGSSVVFSIYALHRNARWFPDPLAFRPDRWLPEHAAHLPRGAYLPFSTGIGKCIGDHFALDELAAVLDTVTARWNLRYAGKRPPRERIGLTIRPDAVPVVCEPRH